MGCCSRRCRCCACTSELLSGITPGKQLRLKKTGARSPGGTVATIPRNKPRKSARGNTRENVQSFLNAGAHNNSAHDIQIYLELAAACFDCGSLILPECLTALKKQFAHVHTPATERSDWGGETPAGADDQWNGDSP